MKTNLTFLSMILLISQTIAMDDKDRPADLNAAHSSSQTTVDYDSKTVPCPAATSSKKETPKTGGMGAWESAWEKGSGIVEIIQSLIGIRVMEDYGKSAYSLGLLWLHVSSKIRVY